MNKAFNADLARMWVEPATKESNNKLYAIVASGCPKARDEMIQSNIGMVVALVNQYLKVLPNFKYLWDDLVSQGILALTLAVTQMAAGFVVENPSGYMSLCIQRAIGEGLENEQTIRVPERSRRRSLEKGVTLRPPKQDEVDLFVEYNDTEADSKFFYDPRKMQELRQLLDDCCENEIDREIIRLREEGHVDREISIMLDLPLTTTYVMRRALYARFLELSGWKGVA